MDIKGSKVLIRSPAQSPKMSKKPTGASKGAPTSIAGVRPKPTANRLSRKEPVTEVSATRIQPLHHQTSKAASTPPPKQSCAKIQGKKSHESVAAAKHEKAVKAKAGFAVAVSKIDKERLTSTDEEHENFHVTDKSKHHLTKEVAHQQESDHSSTTVGSVPSLTLIASEHCHPMRVSLSDIANNSEQIFGIQIPNVMISGEEEIELFEMIAGRVTKWKMLGRYLGVDDEALDDIEIHNHFIGERCLKMLKRFKADGGDGATYVKLAIALKDTMYDSLVTDISKYFPEYEQPDRVASANYSEFNDVIQLPSDLEEIDGCLRGIKRSFELQRNNGKHKALLQISYPSQLANSRASNPLCFDLYPLTADSVRVVEDVCIAAVIRKVQQLSVNIKYE